MPDRSSFESDSSYNNYNNNRGYGHNNNLYPTISHDSASSYTQSINVPVNVPHDVAEKHRQQHAQLALLQRQELLNLATSPVSPTMSTNRFDVGYVGQGSSGGYGGGNGMDMGSRQGQYGGNGGYGSNNGMEEFMMDAKKRRVEPKYDPGE